MERTAIRQEQNIEDDDNNAESSEQGGGGGGTQQIIQQQTYNHHEIEGGRYVRQRRHYQSSSITNPPVEVANNNTNDYYDNIDSSSSNNSTSSVRNATTTSTTDNNYIDSFTGTNTTRISSYNQHDYLPGTSHPLYTPPPPRALTLPLPLPTTSSQQQQQRKQQCSMHIDNNNNNNNNSSSIPNEYYYPLAILELNDIVLLPGSTLPIRITNRNWIRYLGKQIDNQRRMNHQPQSSSSISTTSTVVRVGILCNSSSLSSTLTKILRQQNQHHQQQQHQQQNLQQSEYQAIFDFVERQFELLDDDNDNNDDMSNNNILQDTMEEEAEIILQQQIQQNRRQSWTRQGYGPTRMRQFSQRLLNELGDAYSFTDDDDEDIESSSSSSSSSSDDNNINIGNSTTDLTNASNNDADVAETINRQLDANDDDNTDTDHDVDSYFDTHQQEQSIDTDTELDDNNDNNNFQYHSDNHDDQQQQQQDHTVYNLPANFIERMQHTSATTLRSLRENTYIGRIGTIATIMTTHGDSIDDVNNTASHEQQQQEQHQQQQAQANTIGSVWRQNETANELVITVLGTSRFRIISKVLNDNDDNSMDEYRQHYRLGYNNNVIQSSTVHSYWVEELVDDDKIPLNVRNQLLSPPNNNSGGARIHQGGKQNFSLISAVPHPVVSRSIWPYHLFFQILDTIQQLPEFQSAIDNWIQKQQSQKTQQQHNQLYEIDKQNYRTLNDTNIKKDETDSTCMTNDNNNNNNSMHRTMLASYFQKNPNQFCFWLASNIALEIDDKLLLLQMSSTMERLQYLYNKIKLQQYNQTNIHCKYCGYPLARTYEMFTLSGTEGTTGNYVNMFGCVHQTITIRTLGTSTTRISSQQGTTTNSNTNATSRRQQFHAGTNENSNNEATIEAIENELVTFSGRPETRDSWFPGYSWLIMSCGFCGHHLGWKFQTVTSDSTSANITTTTTTTGDSTIPTVTPSRRCTTNNHHNSSTGRPENFYGFSAANVSTFVSPLLRQQQ